MAIFDLEKYETVEVRLARFWADEAHKDARLVTINRTTDADRAKGYWVIETRLYLTAGDQSLDLPKATGWAFEVEGGKGANAFAALENAETSSLGRCLANYGLSGNKGVPRASRDEMQKVVRNSRNWLAEADALTDIDALRLIWSEARAQNAPKTVLDKLAERAKQMGGN